MKPLGFKIWYSDHQETGTTFEDWEKLQETDIQIVVVFYPTQLESGIPDRILHSGADFYGCDEDLRFTRSNDRADVSGSIKYGKYMDEDVYRGELLQTVLADTGETFLINTETATE